LVAILKATMQFNFFDTIRKSDRTEAINNILEGSYPRRELFLITALSAVIAAVGLKTDNLVLVIGSMIIAPLLMPLLGSGLGIAMENRQIVATSIRTIAIATVASLLLVVPFALLVTGQSHTADDSFYNSIVPNFESAVVAVIAGIVSTFAVSKERLNESISGVAISVALVPPLAGLGIAISEVNQSLIITTGGQYLMNVALIIATSAAVFRYLDFDESLIEARKKLTQEAKTAKREASESQKE